MASPADAFWFGYRMLGSLERATRIALGTTGSDGQPDLARLTDEGIAGLRELEHERETYPGPWLPEPVELALDDGPDRTSLPFLLCLDALSPTERAAYLLAEVHGEPAASRAAALGRDRAGSDALLARAQHKVARGRPPVDASAGRRRDVADRFRTAAGRGDLGALRALMARDVAWVGDAGGLVTMKALQHDVGGVDHVLRLLILLLGHSGRPEPRELNGQPGLVTIAESGAVTTASTLQIDQGHVHAVHCVANPDKLVRRQP